MKTKNIYQTKNQTVDWTILSTMVCAIFCVFTTACSEQYNIKGDSTVTSLDGRMLYLKAPDMSAEFKNIDSCEIVHGKFNFMGMVDSTTMGEIFMDNEGFMPIVIETGNISISISDTEHRVVGSTLNDRLYRFIEHKARIEEEIMRTSDMEADMILAGIHPFEAQRRVSVRNTKLYSQLEALETDFIIHNCNNILGPTYFSMLCSQYTYPIITSQIAQIIKKTNGSFKKNPQVRGYIEAAQKNMKLIHRNSPK